MWVAQANKTSIVNSSFKLRAEDGYLNGMIRLRYGTFPYFLS